MLSRSLAFNTAFAAVAVQTPAEQLTFLVAEVEIVSAASADVAATGRAIVVSSAMRMRPDKLDE
jgi:hypothetical protein